MPAFPKPSATETDPVASPAVSAEATARAEADAAHAALTTSAHGGIVASDDGRLTNARTPTAHKTTHATGGSDAIAPSDIGAATAAAAAAAQSTADGAVVLVATKARPILPWATATAYLRGEAVTNSGHTYTANDAHTSGATFAGDLATHWTLLPVTASDVGAIATSALDTDSTFAANSDSLVPSQKAVKTALALKAPVASPTFTGSPAAPTQSAGDNSTKLATTAYADAAAATLVLLAPGTQARNTIQPSSDVVALTLKLKASGSANLTEWMNSSGSVLAKVTASGGIWVAADLYANGAAYCGSVQSKAVTGAYINMSGVGVDVIGRTNAGYVPLSVTAMASQTGNLFEVRDSSAVVLSTFSEHGYFTTRKVTAPADAELSTSEVALWFDNTSGAAKLKIKGKDSGGTVRTGEVALT